VIANAKHYFNNNQENDRHDVSENVDERTQMEIYLPPFKGAVDAGLLSVMCANNRVNTADYDGPLGKGEVSSDRQAQLFWVLHN
jgi:beta-glucosidase-like glycosyl hydrolase